MKLLVLASRFPYPLEKGDKLRLYYQLQEFAKVHEVVLVALHEQAISEADREAVGAFCTQMYTLPIRPLGSLCQAALGWPGGRSLQVGYFWRARLHDQISQIMADEKPDHIFCQLIRMTAYVRTQSVPVSLDYMDCFSLGTSRRAEAAPRWQRWLWRREAILLKRYEQAIFADMAHCYIISERDREALELPGEAAVSISPNGLDLQKFESLPNIAEAAEISFVGNMGYFPNVQAAVFLVEQIMPLVWKQKPDVRVLLAGARPAAAVQKLGQDSRVTVTGWVEDIRLPYQQGKLFVAPLFTGSGQQNKILEAMALGRPCLTTPLVNDAIGAPEKAIALAEDAQAFAQQICDLLDSPDSRSEMGRAGQHFVQSQMDWTAAVRPIMDGFEQAAIPSP